ncbi:hypothetical protein QBC47DRAFT_432242, partial [Echria macrotheca]
MSPRDTQIVLIPYDFESSAHHARLVQQRVSCGFGAEQVDGLTAWCKDGTTTIYWIVLSEEFPDREEAIAAHVQKYPEEIETLTDTARITFKRPHNPSGVSFTPIGHVGVAQKPSVDARIGLPPDIPIAWLIAIYTSWVLQGRGIGGSAMRAAEAIAADPTGPIGARLMVLDSIPESLQFDATYQDMFYVERGLPLPLISNQKWYEKQGYRWFRDMELEEPIMWTQGDRTIPIQLGYYKKFLVSG